MGQGHEIRHGLEQAFAIVNASNFAITARKLNLKKDPPYLQSCLRCPEQTLVARQSKGWKLRVMAGKHL